MAQREDQAVLGEGRHQLGPTRRSSPHQRSAHAEPDWRRFSAGPLIWLIIGAKHEKELLNGVIRSDEAQLIAERL
jgi:hypothetical protein